MDERKIALTIVSITDILVWWPNVEIWIKVISLVGTIVVGAFACWSYYTNIKLKRTETKIKDQEYEVMRKKYLEEFRPK